MPTEKIKSLSPTKMDDIIRAAIKEFSQNPYHEASYNRIIRAAKLSKGTMYYYFKSKEDLFTTILTGIRHGIEAVLRPLPLPEETMLEGEFWQKSRALLERLFSFRESQPLIFRLLIRNAMKNSSHLPSPAAAMIEKTDSWLSAYLEHGQAVGAVRRDQPMTLLLDLSWSLFVTAILWLEGQGGGSKAAHATFISDLLERSLSPIAPAVSIPMAESLYGPTARDQSEPTLRA